MAEWQNGYAEDCKSLEVGSIPVSASALFFEDLSVFGVLRFCTKGFPFWKLHG